jgi:hypothetical protein
MYNIWMLRKELKDIFVKELTPSEKLFFLKKSRESIDQKGYPAGEALFQYCYFLTLRERLCGMNSSGSEGYMRFLHVQGAKDIEDAITLYKERLEKKKLPAPDPAGYKYIEYISK